MNIPKRRIDRLFSAALALMSLAVPALAAPADTVLPTAPVVKVTTAVPVLKPAAVKALMPVAPPVTAKSGQATAKRRSDYRYSNPTRWHSDMTANSIRNQ